MLSLGEAVRQALPGHWRSGEHRGMKLMGTRALKGFRGVVKEIRASLGGPGRKVKRKRERGALIRGAGTGEEHSGGLGVRPCWAYLPGPRTWYGQPHRLPSIPSGGGSWSL